LEELKMSTDSVLGLFWIFAAGVTQGAFPLPMKYTRTWKWEHLWFWYSIIAFLILPFVIAAVTVPQLRSVYSLAPHDQLILTALFGMGWGAGSVFFGLGLDALGMSLGFPIMTGLFTALGAFIPLALLTPEMVFKRNGLLIIAGNIITILGVVISSVAGHLRDQKLGNRPTPGMIGPKRSFPTALTICVLGGVLSAMFNFGYAFGSRIIESAMALGATRDNALNAMWLVLIPAGGLINVGYCLYLFQKNKSLNLLVRPATLQDWFGACAMSLLWTGSVILYGWGANYLGRLGSTLGWSLWNAILIGTTIVCGFATHEWNGVRGRPLSLLLVGIGVLILGMFVLGMGV
jgi:L-rhamnose-H+ transport protein